MHKKLKKMSLNRETLRSLSDSHMGNVAGGISGLACTGNSNPGTAAMSECIRATCGNACLTHVGC